ncbi:MULTISPECIES: hypothetical protein [Paenibacillus]|jgi:hypothetical protein|uniref:hypothetical protein n=1 Tax=Paenibacillus TaxID=44249 RepID=UPI00240E2242|nr:MULTISPECIES: hypothetical protein [Paenibacillus]MCI1777707.1 hypothetical protein [Paenibacillus lautus]WFB57646.1 hypothetical protein P0X86_27375 [Paenibacillus sp. BR1-192]
MVIILNHEEIRKGVTQSRESESGVNWLFGEIIIIAVISGIYFSSWWVFGGVFLGSIILMNIKPVRYLLFIILSLGCGVVGWIIGQWFDSLGASVVISVIATLASGGAHIYANKWLNDI